MSAQIFIDAENVKPEIGFQAIEKFRLKYHIERVNIIGNETAISSKYLEAGYKIKNCFYGKNSADTWLCTEIAKTIFEKPEVDVIIIISSDRDFLAAIKLATDQKRKVILVSDGNGHKNLKALFYDLRINPDFVELVDFKTDLAVPEKSKGKVELMKNNSPKSDADKIKAFCKILTPPMQSFFTKHAAEFKFISVRHEDNLVEIPFIDGINISTFTNILIALKIIKKAEQAKKIIADSSLKLDDNKIYFDEPKTLKTEKNPFDDVINYFVAHAAESKNIFIKCDGKIHEVPFINGISLNMFSRLLKGYAIEDDANKIKKIIAESFLDLRDNRIYFHSEEKISAELEPYLKNIPQQALDFIKQNERDLKLVSIAHNDKVHKVPFVEGINLPIFVHMLRHLKIIGKNSASQKILIANGFTIKDNLVYKKS